MSRRIKLEENGLISDGFPPIGNFYDGYYGNTFSQLDENGNLSYVGAGISAKNLNIQTITSASTVTPYSTSDLVNITDQSGPLIISNPTGTVSDGKFMRIRINDNGSTQSISYGNKFRAFCDNLPTATLENRTLYLDIIYNEIDGKWDVLHNHFQLLPTIPNFNSFMLTVQAGSQTFSTGSGFTVNEVRVIKNLPDGKILVGGSFTQYKGVAANRIIRLNYDGSIDSTFDYGSGFNNTVMDIEIQPDGKILAGGYFTTYNGQIATGPTFTPPAGTNWFDQAGQSGLVRLNPNGTLDTSFGDVGSVGFGSVIAKIKLQSDGKILVAGSFLTVKKPNSYAEPNNKIVRLNPNGVKDYSFDNSIGFNTGWVYDIAIQSDGKILAVGDFQSYKGVFTNRYIRLNSNGSIDTTFSTFAFNNPLGPIKCCAIQPDPNQVATGPFSGKIIIGLYWDALSAPLNMSPVGAPKGIIRLNANGTKDTTFETGDTWTSGFSIGPNVLDPYFNYGDWPQQGKQPGVESVAIQPDGKIIAVGNFNHYKDNYCRRVVRINTDGSFDDTFNCIQGFEKIPNTVKIDTNNFIYIGGLFDTYKNQTHKRFVKLLPSGNVASSLNKFTIPTTGNGYSYKVITSEQTLTNQTGNCTLFWSSPGTYSVEITGSFPRIYFNYAAEDKDNILEINRWGDLEWNSMEKAFAGCSNLEVNATDIPNFSTSALLSLKECFALCSSLENSNGSIGLWDTSNVSTMNSMFLGTPFNQSLSSWDTSSVTDMSSMFKNSDFDSEIFQFTSNVTNMSSMFANGAITGTFSSNIIDWDTSSVTDMSYMFSNAQSFNQDLSFWDVSTVTNFSNMFNGASSFNGALNPEWNVSSAQNMSYMFASASSYNKQISTWNVSNVTNFEGMFENAVAYDQLLNFNPSSWFGSAFNPSGIISVNMNNMFANSGMSTENFTDTVSRFGDIVNEYGRWYYNSFLNQFGLTFSTDRPGLSGSSFSFAGDAKDFLIGSAGWTMSGFSIFQPFEFVIDTNLGINTEFTLPLVSSGNYNFNVNWGDGNNDTITSWNQIEKTHTYDFGGTYTVSISGTIEGWSFELSNIDYEKLTQIIKFGKLKLGNVGGYFASCNNLVTVSGIPDLTGITSLHNMFDGCSSIDNITDINSWNVSNITDFTGMFQNSSFNQDISNWNVSSATNMNSLFYATPFNQPIGSWDVSSVTVMSSMFEGATSFNGDISGWDVSSVTLMDAMFQNATSFNQNLGSWDVTSLVNAASMFNGVTLSTSNYDSLLIGWSTQPVQSNVIFSGGNSQYTVVLSRASLISTKLWTITDGGEEETFPTP